MELKKGKLFYRFYNDLANINIYFIQLIYIKYQIYMEHNLGTIIIGINRKNIQLLWSLYFNAILFQL